MNVHWNKLRLEENAPGQPRAETLIELNKL